MNADVTHAVHVSAVLSVRNVFTYVYISPDQQLQRKCNFKLLSSLYVNGFSRVHLVWYGIGYFGDDVPSQSPDDSKTTCFLNQSLDWY